jgi:rRNA maturation endonuclease Nob1
MATANHPLPKEFESVAVSRAVLCVDCEQITEARKGTCPICGSSALFSLAVLLQEGKGVPME